MNSKSIMRVRKNRDNPFVMMDKRIFANTSLSWKAKGILGYLLSKPDDWVIRISDLIKQSTDGRDAVYSGVKELRKAGYVELVDVRNESGKIISWGIFSIRRTTKPNRTRTNHFRKNPDLGFPYLENPTLLIMILVIMILLILIILLLIIQKKGKTYSQGRTYPHGKSFL